MALSLDTAELGADPDVKSDAPALSDAAQTLVENVPGVTFKDGVALVPRELFDQAVSFLRYRAAEFVEAGRQEAADALRALADRIDADA